ncbi:hypothetical protein RND81_02G028300 [Saponaria officinalis]|uniref:Knottins-like domain-containing protein n=1 Tax=Saponaria officinalis TaxID=3572 RepID=A0AAW1MT50_SAPOF
MRPAIDLNQMGSDYPVPGGVSGGSGEGDYPGHPGAGGHGGYQGGQGGYQGGRGGYGGVQSGYEGAAGSRLCSSISNSFRGPCFYRANCHSACISERFQSGHCTGRLRGKCRCEKPC